jgi:hypothetical protein
MTWEAWQDGLRRSALNQGWREVAADGRLLEFLRDDVRVGMTIDPDARYGLVTQRVLK